VERSQLLHPRRRPRHVPLAARKPLALVFHRGAKARADGDTFEFMDPTGLLQWASSDCGVVTVTDSQDLKAKKADIVRLVNL
jgi:hypothetical protein